MEGVAAGGIAGHISGGAEAKQCSASSTPSSTPSPPQPQQQQQPAAAFHPAGAHGMEAAPEAAGLATGMMGVDHGDLFRGKKRGRPRKYGSDGMALALTSPASASPFSSDGKRSKGRPPGSGKNQLLAALGTMSKPHSLLPLISFNSPFE